MEAGRGLTFYGTEAGRELSMAAFLKEVGWQLVDSLWEGDKEKSVPLGGRRGFTF
jgi:hypothetical protein